MLTPVELAGVMLGGGAGEAVGGMLGAGDRLALLLERIDELVAAATTTSAAGPTRCSAGSSAGSTG